MVYIQTVCFTFFFATTYSYFIFFSFLLVLMQQLYPHLSVLLSKTIIQKLNTKIEKITSQVGQHSPTFAVKMKYLKRSTIPNKKSHK